MPGSRWPRFWNLWCISVCRGDWTRLIMWVVWEWTTGYWPWFSFVIYQQSGYELLKWLTKIVWQTDHLIGLKMQNWVVIVILFCDLSVIGQDSDQLSIWLPSSNLSTCKSTSEWHHFARPTGLGLNNWVVFVIWLCDQRSGKTLTNYHLVAGFNLRYIHSDLFHLHDLWANKVVDQILYVQLAIWLDQTAKLGVHCDLELWSISDWSRFWPTVHLLALSKP